MLLRQLNGSNHNRKGKVQCRQSQGLCPKKAAKLAKNMMLMMDEIYHFG
jgi:hypothetical protein